MAVTMDEIEVTPEMRLAGRYVAESDPADIEDAEDLALRIYRAMRALEPKRPPKNCLDCGGDAVFCDCGLMDNA